MTDEIDTKTLFVGRYQVQRELGRGGMGSVYLAYDVQFHKPMAIKAARPGGPEVRAQFRREALYLQRLRHHNLPQVLDVFSDTQRDFLVMEYIPGDDLETLVQQQGAQPEWLVLRWADELLDVLDYLHTQSPPIIHRDVKPGNLKLRQNDALVLVDFGIAEEYRPEGEVFVGATAVTPGFSPPEQYSDSLADARTDVYSAGATLYYLLTGVIPAAAPDRASGGAALVPVSRLAPQASQAAGVLVDKALSLVREERWANAAEMRRAAVVAARRLASTAPQHPLPETVHEPSATGHAGTAPRHSKAALGLAGVAALLGVALLVVAALLWTAPSRQPNSSALAEPATPLVVTDSAVPVATELPKLPRPTMVPATAEPTATRAAMGGIAPVLEPLQPAGSSQPATVGATSTPIPTRTPTRATGATSPTVSPGATRRNSTSTPRLPGMPLPAATARPTATPEQPVTPAPSPTIIIALLEPAAGAVGGGERLFRWQTNHDLNGNQAFELVFWRPGQDAIHGAFAPVGVTQQAAGGMRVNLDEADEVLGALLDPGDYLWGVLLVETNPYRRIALLSEARAFRFERSGGGDDGPPPEWTPPPP